MTPSTPGNISLSHEEQLAVLTQEKDEYQKLYRESQQKCNTLEGERLLYRSNQLNDKERIESATELLREKNNELSHENEELGMTILEHEETCRKLQKKLRSEREQSKKEKSAREKTQNETSALEKTHRDKCLQYEAEIKELKASLEDKNLLVKKANCQNKKLKADVHTLETELKCQADALEKKLKDEQEILETKLKDEVCTLETKLEDERHAFEEKLKDERQMFESLHSRARELGEREINEVKAQKTALLSRMKEIRQRCDEKVFDINKAVTDRELEIRILKDLLSTAVTDAEQKTTDSTKLASELRRCHETQADLREELRVQKVIVGRQDAIQVRVLAFMDWRQVSSLYGSRSVDLSEEHLERWTQAYFQGHRDVLLEALKMGRSIEEALKQAETTGVARQAGGGAS